MEAFVKGDVVVLPFPFSNLRSAKKRPAIVVANLSGDDLVLAQITSSAKSDAYAIDLGAKDFSDGGLKQASRIRPNKLFTADKSLIAYKIGSLTPVKVKEVEKGLVDILRK